MNSDQVWSLVRTVLKVLGGALAAHGMSKTASWINAEDTIGVLMAIGGWVSSHVTHKDPTKTL